ncbi:MAG: response regulator transcription factor [Oscillospiraceae bacterium]|nr:response regulator transcription factor [Oscillospiraceae bacterium]
MRIICVDNGKLRLSCLQEQVQSIVPDAQIYTFRDPEQALHQAKAGGCDILLTEIDVGWSETGGLLLAKYLKEVNPKAKIIFMTVCMEYEHEAELRYIEFDGCIQKPYLFETLEDEFRKLGCVAL